jgi:hypothetical protein
MADEPLSAPGTGARGAAARAIDRPDPEFEVVSADIVPRSATPTLSFAVGVRDGSGAPIQMIALTILITIEPGLRAYGPEDRERLVELFGEPERWGSTASALRWTQVETVVPAFTSRATHTFTVQCTYDHEIAAAKYFGGVAEGSYPLRFHFNGTTYYQGLDGRPQMVPLAWDRSTRFELPVRTWRRMIESHYPRGGWVRIGEETLQRLGRHKAATGAPTIDDAIGALLDGGEPSPEVGGAS